MSIKVGDKIPSVTLTQMTADGPKPVSTDDVFAGKKVVLFAVPGAFTPLCSGQHLSGYVKLADQFKAKGVDSIVCVAVNDAFVMGAWGKDQQVGDKVVLLADGNADFAKAVGLELNVPLFAGFAVQNRVKETLVLENKAESDLDNAKRSVALGTRQAFAGVQSGLAQVKAYEAAEASAKLALEATQLGYRVGVRINKDVLDAQTQVAATQRDLYKARYDVILATVKLRQASGTLKAEDLGNLNKLLATPAK